MTLRRLAPFLSLALLLALPAAAQADGLVSSATGVKRVNGEKLYLDVVVAVAPGQSARKATDKALAQQGARPVKPPWAGGGGGPNGGGGGGEAYFYTGLEWSNAVTQSYNPANEPLGLNALAHLQSTQSTWSQVSGSTYRIGYGGSTSRCPSLVRECPGPQVGDDNQDVAWLGLGGSTLGVTWYTTSDPEADMALNTRFAWKGTCNSSGNGYDVETVLLHENGHVAGLDHAPRTDSVMYPSYQSPQCSLYPYDERSLANLY
jgi:hypothetical protein